MTAIIESKELFWQQHLENFKASGMSRKKYCLDNKLNYDRFSYWIKRLSLAATPPSSTATTHITTMSSC